VDPERRNRAPIDDVVPGEDPGGRGKREGPTRALGVRVMAEPSETVEELAAKIRPILDEHGVQRAALYGSVVRGEASEGSDVDLLVELPEEKSLLDLVALKRDLEQAVGREVDVAEYGSLHPLVQDTVDREQVGLV
jgi:predicted nucleotidyltransferase